VPRPAPGGTSSIGNPEAREAALDYAKERMVFGKPISAYQLTQQKLAEMALEIGASRMVTYRPPVRRAAQPAPRSEAPADAVPATAGPDLYAH